MAIDKIELIKIALRDYKKLMEASLKALSAKLKDDSISDEEWWQAFQGVGYCSGSLNTAGGLLKILEIDDDELIEALDEFSCSPAHQS